MVDLQERQAAAATAAAAPAIHCVELTRRFGKTVALAGLTMTVPRGEVFGFLGPNGAGKTTAVKLLLGLLRPSSGEGFVLGRPLSDLTTRTRIGYLPELFRYQPWLSGREVLGVHCELGRLPRARWREEVDSVLATVGLADRGGDRVGNYSKGMQQRLGLGVALLGSPELVFLDEPTSALDPVGRHDVRQIIHRLRERGTAVFLNSHLLTEVEMVCDRVAMVDHGRVIATGTLDELLSGTSCRLRLTGLDLRQRASLRRFGAIDDDGEWLTVHGLEPDRVPELVAEAVALGASVHAVEPRHQSLEDRFLELLGHSSEGGRAR
ncbi:MAG: ABC transporter ATP-binding protein [Candidatus Dormibacteraeota bacterium]|nr:ABC transporter ATP-binding protein [Candidatus Dormibacteraeota bacterium]